MAGLSDLVGIARRSVWWWLAGRSGRHGCRDVWSGSYAGAGYPRTFGFVARPLSKNERDSSRRHNPWAADIYDRARARGASHAHATRILGRAWSQVIWRLWHDHDTYDPSRTPP